MIKKADLSNVAEKKNKANNLQKEGAIARSGRFLADRPARFQRAGRPVCDKDDPRTFNEITPYQAHPSFADGVPTGCDHRGWPQLCAASTFAVLSLSLRYASRGTRFDFSTAASPTIRLLGPFRLIRLTSEDNDLGSRWLTETN